MDNVTEIFNMPENNTTASTDLNSTTQESKYNAAQALEWIIPVTILYTIICATGLSGNISTCSVIARNKTMHTVTNYYLFNLAISDMTLLIFGLLPELYYDWTPLASIPSPVCCVMQRFIFEVSLHVTILTITAFTVDRYIAICHPFWAMTIGKFSRVIKIITGAWLLAVCLSVPQVFRMCSYCKLTNDFIKDADQLLFHSSEIRSLVIFGVPIILMVVLYIRIAVQLKRPTEISSSRNSTADHKKVVKMLVAVVISFFICWAPFHIHRIFAMYFRGLTDEEQKELAIEYISIYHLSGVFFYLSATINPILYSIMSSKFRTAFKETFACKAGTQESNSDISNRTMESIKTASSVC